MNIRPAPAPPPPKVVAPKSPREGRPGSGKSTKSSKSEKVETPRSGSSQGQVKEDEKDPATKAKEKLQQRIDMYKVKIDEFELNLRYGTKHNNLTIFNATGVIESWEV